MIALTVRWENINTQVCCSCILVGMCKSSVYKWRSHNRKQSFWGFFHISRCSNLPVCHLTIWEKNKLPTCRVTGRVTSAIGQNDPKDLHKIIFRHLYSFTKKQQHMLQMTVSRSEIKVHPHTDRPAVTQVYTLISGKCLRPIKLESHGNKDQ